MGGGMQKLTGSLENWHEDIVMVQVTCYRAELRQ